MTQTQHEENVDYTIRSLIEEVKDERNLDLSVELQPRAQGQERADVIIRTPLQNLLVFENKVSEENVFDIQVQRKARDYANELNTAFFAVSNIENTLLFRNDKGPLSKLLLKIWTDIPSARFKEVIEEIIEFILGIKTASPPIDEFVEEYSEFFYKLSPLVKIRIDQQLLDGEYNSRFIEKITLMGLNPAPENIVEWERNKTIIAEQAAYIFLNQIFFFELLLHHLDKNAIDHHLVGLTEDIPQDPEQFEIYLQQTFNILTKNYDFKPIFQNDCVFQIKFSTEMISLLIQFAQNVRQYNLDQFDHNLVAQIWQNVIPDEKRKEMGQIYTPSIIARLICHLAINKEDVILLDPACGCGTFLKEGYQRLQLLKRKGNRQQISGSLHNEILSQIWGIEINTFPAHLTTINLSFQNEPILTDVVNVIVADYLGLEPLRSYAVRGWSVTKGEEVSRRLPQKFNVIVGNPPYVRHELLNDIPKFREKMEIFANYLSGVYPVPSGRKRPIRCNLNQRVDYYAYFLWSSTYLLENKGILSFIISNKWLDVGYGKEIKQFLLDNYCIKAIIGFEKNVFQNVDVSTVILYLVKEKQLETREKNKVKFILLKRELTIPQIVNIVKNTSQSDMNDDYSVNLIIQKNLQIEDKWTNHIVFVPLYDDLKNHPKILRLGNGIITDVDYGTKSGDNEFFYLKENEVEDKDIPPNFLVRGIKSARNLPDTLIIDEKDVPHFFVYIPRGTDPSIYPNLEEYIRFGEEKGIQNRPSFRGTCTYQEWK